MATLTIFSADWCRHCVAAHAFVDENLRDAAGISKIERVDVGKEPWRRRQMLATLPPNIAAAARDGSQPMTIPQIFIGDGMGSANVTYVGGNSELRAMHASGELAKEVARINAMAAGEGDTHAFPSACDFGPNDVLQEIPEVFRKRWQMNVESLAKSLRATAGDAGEGWPLEIVVSIDAPGKLVVVLASDGSPHEAGSIRTRVTDDTKLSCLRAIEGSKTVVVDHDQGHNADTARGYTMSISSPWRQRAGFYLVGTVTVLAKSSAALSEWMPGHKATVELFRDILEREVTALAKM